MIERGSAIVRPQVKRVTPPPVLIEICVDSLAAAVAAAAGGADRLELNAALSLDGLTPSLGLLTETCKAVGDRVPLIAMARPAPGGFCYGDADFRVLRRDVDLLLQKGADGIAFGVLTEDGAVDVRRCRRVIRQIESAGRGSGEAVFHRAFDVVRNPAVALDQLIDLGFRRVMTSGQQPTALGGARLIAQLAARAAGRIEVLPAGGIRPSNALAVVSRTGCNQVHASLRPPGKESKASHDLRERVSCLRAALGEAQGQTSCRNPRRYKADA